MRWGVVLALLLFIRQPALAEVKPLTLYGVDAEDIAAGIGLRFYGPSANAGCAVR